MAAAGTGREFVRATVLAVLSHVRMPPLLVEMHASRAHIPFFVRRDAHAADVDDDSKVQAAGIDGWPETQSEARAVGGC